MDTTTAQLSVALDGASLHGRDVTVVDATHDSRLVQPGWLFCCVVGERFDGHDAAAAAAAGGAAALLVERVVDVDLPQVVVPDVRAAMGPAAAAIHAHPARAVTLVGVTGTNGKTTTAHMLEAVGAVAQQRTGIVGTLGARIAGHAVAGVRTTPEATDLQRLLARMRDSDVTFAAMEVSSHGLDLHRVDGVRFDVAVFTNLSRDHLDFHPTLEDYFAAKAKLFTAERARSAVICVDDVWGRRLSETVGIPHVTFGTRPSARWRIVDVTATVAGSTFALVGPAGRVELATSLLGLHNVRNAAGAYLAAVAAGIDADAAVAGIALCGDVPGRMQHVDVAGDVTVLVDYAHTPDALEAVIRHLKSLLTCGQRLTVVVGAGGNRDAGKRPLMGAAAARADRAVLTSDNPRDEDPAAILDAVEAGARSAGGAGEVVRMVDRAEAIAFAIERARPGDVVLIAGKGHESGQEVAGVTVPFDDAAVAVAAAARTFEVRG